MDKKFSFFESYHRALSRVPDDSYGRVVRAMSSYVFEGIEPNLTETIDLVAWELIRPILEKGTELSLVRADAGRAGKGVSRNVGNNHAAKDENQSKTKQNQNKNKTNQNGIGVGEGKGKGKEDYKENIIKENNFDYVSPDYKEIFMDWLGYKKERGEAYKPRGVKAFYSKLLNLSGNSPEKARLIIEQSMSNNYAGIFQLRNYDTDNTTIHRPTPADNIAAAQAAHLAEFANLVATTANNY